MNQRNIFLWAAIGLLMMVMINMFYQQPTKNDELTYSQFLIQVEQNQVKEVVIQGHKLSGKLTGDVPFSTYAPNDPKLVERLTSQPGVAIKAAPPEDSPWYIVFLTSWMPILLLVVVWIFFMRQMQGGGGKTMSFGRSRARLVSQESAKVTFDNVAGVDEAKEELTEVVDFLSNPKKFTRLGGRIPKGVLLVGPPGTGKTLLARAVAGEAGVPFYSISGSDFVEMFVGVGASRVRDLFAQGKKNAPCLIFIDEIDAVGRQRGAGLGGGHDEREQTLNQLLVEMDGFEANEGVILIAATNRPDVLDPALLRPGRFDRQVIVPPPDIRGRKQILAVHAKRTPLADDVSFDVIAKGTPGFSGADLENLVNEAALLAAKENKDVLTMAEFEDAKDKLLMGKERRTMVRTREELKRTAYHEAGHAIVGKLLPQTDPVHKVTIIPRGRALGVTFFLPEEDKYGMNSTEITSKIGMAFGGRAAELIVFNEMTTGASQDIKEATRMARSMVCQYGMSEALGPMAVGGSSQEVFVGREWVANREHSEDTARLVDAEVKRIIDEGMAAADRILRENIDTLHTMADLLLERETLTGDEVELIMQGKSLPPMDEKAVSAKAASKAAKDSDANDASSGNGNDGLPAQEARSGRENQKPEENRDEEQAENGPEARESDVSRWPGEKDAGSGASPFGAAASSRKKQEPKTDAEARRKDDNDSDA